MSESIYPELGDSQDDGMNPSGEAVLLGGTKR